MASGTATVKAVLSGDTLLLVGRAGAGPPPEIQLTLSHVQCPRVARGPQQQDEPFAWPAREFLRRTCVGKTVSFRVTQTVPSINRTFGEVTLAGEQLAKLVVQHGWVTLKEPRDREREGEGGPGSGAGSGLYSELLALHLAAKEDKRGLFTDDQEARKNSVRLVDWAMDAAHFHAQLLVGRKSPSLAADEPAVVSAVIEHVRDGASFRCYLPDHGCYLSFAFAGTTCPRINSSSSSSGGDKEKDKEKEPAAAEPFALQSKLFTECRLLHRRLDLAVRGVTSGRGEPMLLGSVLHPRGDISLELMKAGLARVADWTLALLPRGQVVALRAAETAAKHERRGVWAQQLPPLPPCPALRVFEATVVEVLSGDTVVVLEGQAERRVTFSSIRVPRQQQGQGQARGSGGDPFAAECKEFVRQKLIGKPVVVSLEYQRGEGGAGGKEARFFGSVYYGTSRQQQGGGGGKGKGQDIASQLVQEGLAVTVRHRADEPRAAGYDMLLVEEVAAVQRKKGMHGPQSRAATSAMTDVTGDPKKAKAVHALLSRDKTYRGVVEHVFTASRFKISIPAENVTLQLALAQVRTPLIKTTPPAGSGAVVKTEEEGEEKEEALEEGEVRENPLVKWAEAGKRYSRHHLLQRKVELEISDIDRNGIMMGKLYMYTREGEDGSGGGGGNRAHPVAFSLVQRGLVSVDKWAQRRGGQEVSRLLELQSEAQAEKRGMWVVPNAVPVEVKEGQEGLQEDEEEEGEGDAAAGKSMFRVSLAEIYDGANFAVNFVEQPNESDSSLLRGQMKLAEMEEMMCAFAREVSSGSGGDSGGDSVVANKGTLLAVYHENPSPPAGEGEEAPADVWLRGSVEEKLGGGRARVLFVDYGHRAVVSVSALRALPEPLKHYAPQAVACSLSFLRGQDVSTDAGVAAARALNSLAWGKPCLVKVHGREKQPPASSFSASRLEVSLYAVESFSEEDLQHATNVGVKLVRHGFLRISTTMARKARGGSGSRPRRRDSRRGEKTVARVQTSNETLHELEVAQDLAHKEHLRLWAYGHPGDSDDDDSEDAKKDSGGKKEKEGGEGGAASSGGKK